MFQLSPGVNVSEIDLTTIVPAVGTSAGAFVGPFMWGPVNKDMLIDSELTLVKEFFKPSDDTFAWFYSAANFLAYGNTLHVTRVVGDGANNASTEGGVLIKNENEYEANYADGSGTFGIWAARYPGKLGNSLTISICPSAEAYRSNSGGSVLTTANVGNTTIGVNTDLTSVIQVGDYVRVGVSNPYSLVTAINSSQLTIADALDVEAPAGTFIHRKWGYADEFDAAPGTSSYAEKMSGVTDELHVIVVDKTGLITGTPGTVLEKYPFVSKASDAKQEDGTALYYPKVITKKSNWIYWGDHVSANANNWGNTALSTTFEAGSRPTYSEMTGGTDVLPTNGELMEGWDYYADLDTVDISLLVPGPVDATVAGYIIDNIAEHRRDCVAFISPPADAVIDNVGNESTDIVTFRNQLSSTSFAFMDSGWKYQFDKYNDTYRFVPLCGDMAGLCVKTDTIRDPWFSPAGLNRGNIKNCVRLAWNPDKAYRDELYKNGVNPCVTFPGQGPILYGDKTLQSKPSAFDRINVRRLFIVLEKAIAKAAKYSLFEFNDDFTRAQFVAMVEPFLRTVKGRRGIYDYKVVCDATNNTPEVIDSNSFVGDIYIKPARSINFIQLNFVAVRTGVAFDEIVGKF